MPPVPADPSLLHQAIMNLLTNAIEAVESTGGAVTIRSMYHVPDPLLGSQPPYLEIYVVDTGPGISKDRIKWIFEPFNTTKGGRGTGLGLAVTKRIIDQHHGRIEVDSVEGRGSTFKIILPADTGTDLDPSATAEAKTAEADPLREG
ncbi:MAG: hypothetical protein H6811_08150 [Phycisphaeraceae bacterium]|nr:hypothetical protein [Phycisphaeraceae bacterium]